MRFSPTIAALALWFATVSSSLAADALARPSASDISLKNEIRHATEKGADWLIKSQDPAGHWSTPDQPAVTALALLALQSQELDPDEKAALEKGYRFILSCAEPDGSFHNGKGLVNYNTSLCLLALTVARSSEYQPLIQRARAFLIGTQIDLGEKGKIDNPFDGGIGYGSKGEFSDMGNTLQALEALYYSRPASDTAAPDKELNWQAAIHFLQNCQNLPAYNKQPWASDDPANKGGFVYHPEESKAGELELPSGCVALRSYGSISYAGLLSYIYADLKKDDPRVTAVLDWLRQNYTLKENPGMGQQGLFYYFHTMAKALSAYDLDKLQTTQGAVAWRKELSLRLLNLQNADGSWANENNRWWEKDPALVTAYALLTLGIIERGL